MNLIFMCGYPGTGKLTVAKELQTLTGYKLFHNHLVVDLAASMFDFGSKPFIEFREELWLRSFELGLQNKLEGMIFTFAFEKTVPNDFVDKVTALFDTFATQPKFVELICDPGVLKTRVEKPDRQKYGKFHSYEKLESLIEQGTYYEPELKVKVRKIDNTDKTPEEVTKEIVSHYHL